MKHSSGKVLKYGELVAKGSRGFRILSSGIDRVHELLCERPVNRYMSLDEFESLFRDVDPFPALMLMEYVDAPEMTVDMFTSKGDVVFYQTRTREELLTGLAMSFQTIDRPDLVELARQAGARAAAVGRLGRPGVRGASVAGRSRRVVGRSKNSAGRFLFVALCNRLSQSGRVPPVVVAGSRGLSGRSVKQTDGSPVAGCVTGAGLLSITPP